MIEFMIGFVAGGTVGAIGMWGYIIYRIYMG